MLQGAPGKQECCRPSSRIMPPTKLSNKAIRALILLALVHMLNHRDVSFYQSQQMCHTSQKEATPTEMVLQSSVFTWKVAIIRIIA